MTILLKRQLNEDEKEIILKRHGRKCFATGHDIPLGDSVHYDHIRAYSKGGESELDNIAPMCERHNKEKGQLPLDDFRIKLNIHEFFSSGPKLTLKDLLGYLKTKGKISDFGQRVHVINQDGILRLANHSVNISANLQKCPRTGWEYFYASLPVEIINSDDDVDEKYGLQPRYLILDKVFDLYRHFQVYPVLQPSIGRIYEENILLFDGQHKAAALLWNNKKVLECKIYVNPEVRLLNQANISAHDKFAQTRFFSSVLISKLGAQFGKDFEEYKNIEDSKPKTEIGFMGFLATKDELLTAGERNKRFRSYLYNSIIDDSDNKMIKLISSGNRGSQEQPITVDMLTKSIFACFLFAEPNGDDMLTDKYKRECEFSNNIKLLNDIYELALYSWDCSGKVKSDNQKMLNRIFSSKSIMAWSEIFRDSVCAKLNIDDADDRKRPFYREMTKEEFEIIRGILIRLIGWQQWKSPEKSEIDSKISGNKSAIKQWFKEKGLTTGYLMGAPE